LTEDGDIGEFYVRLGLDSMGHTMKGTMGLFISGGIDIYGEKIQLNNIKNFIVAPNLTNFPDNIMVVTSKQINRGSEAMEIVWTGCSNVNLQKVIIQNSQNNVNFLPINKKYIEDCNTPMCIKKSELKNNVIRIKNKVQKNQIINFKTGQPNDDTNKNSSIEYMLV
jgi:hypothetical protein